MAKVMPLKGVRYNMNRIQDLYRVVCPPYDIISPEAQERYCRLHEQNIVRVELGKDLPGDTPSHNRYTRAAAYLAEWQQQGILIRDPQPTFYLYTVSYRHPQEGAKTLKGFLALVRLEEPEARQILPHEQTFPKAKQDRLQLLRACHANTSPIFTLYSDPENRIMAELEKAVDENRPAAFFLDEEKVQHRLWTVPDPAVQQAVMKQLADQPLFIADGHHRYETALNFRNEMRAHSNNRSPQPYDSVLVFCTSMSDPGMSLLPIHRVILNPVPFDFGTLRQRLAKTFEILSLDFSETNEAEIRRRLFKEMKNRGMSTTVFGMYSQEEQRYQMLVLKESRSVSSPVDRLDVTLFQRHVLEEALGLEDKASEKEGQIRFVKDEETAIETVRSGEAGMAFFLNPTRMDQVRQVVLSGGLMPQKSTYFYPKPLTGLVLNIF